jgi:RNA polymerase sigma-70 factor, ECF subfamily
LNKADVMTRLDTFQLSPILQRSLNGDPQALNELLTKLGPYLRAQLRTHGGTRRGDLDEPAIVQNSLIRISQHIGTLRQNNVQGLLAWVGKIVRFALIDALRQRSRDRSESVGSRIYDLAGHWIAPDPCVDAENRDRLRSAIAQLTSREQQVVLGRFIDGLSDAEISQRVGASITSVRVMRCRALRSLKRLMEGTSVIQKG